MFFEEKCLNKLKNTEFKKNNYNFFKKYFKNFRGRKNKHLIKIQEDNKCTTGVQNNTNTELNEMMKVISDVKSEFHKQIETLKRSKAEMKTKF